MVFLPALVAISRLFYKDEITVICTPIGRQVFEGCGTNIKFVEMNLGYRRFRNIKGVLLLLQTLWALRYKDFAFSLHAYDDPSVSYLLASFLGIKKRIGYQSKIAKAQRFLSDRIPFDAERKVVDINFDLVRYIREDISLQPIRVPINFSLQDREIALSRLSQFNIHEHDSFVVIHTGAKYNYQKWPEEKYAALATQLEERFQIPVVFLTENSDYFLHNKKAIGCLSVKQVSCLLKMAVIFIGNNSGPMHVAAAMGTPSVIVQGPSAFNWNIFWDDVPHIIVKSYLECIPCESFAVFKKRVCINDNYLHGCMKEISVERVMESVSCLINNKKTFPVQTLFTTSITTKDRINGQI